MIETRYLYSLSGTIIGSGSTFQIVDNAGDGKILRSDVKGYGYWQNIPSGYTGSSGTSGTSGNGTSGTSGTSGSMGSTGSNGTSGTSGTSGSGIISGTSGTIPKFSGTTSFVDSSISESYVTNGTIIDIKNLKYVAGQLNSLTLNLLSNPSGNENSTIDFNIGDKISLYTFSENSHGNLFISTDPDYPNNFDYINILSSNINIGGINETTPGYTNVGNFINLGQSDSSGSPRFTTINLGSAHSGTTGINIGSTSRDTINFIAG